MSITFIPDDPATVSLMLDQVVDEALIESQEAIEAVAIHLEDRIRQNISLTDHTLEEIAQLGHPYSTFNIGSGGNFASGMGALGHKPYQVHIQRNVIRGRGGGPMDLVDALGIRYSQSGTEVFADVGINEAQAGHVEYVVLGTKFMVARDFFAGTLLEVVDDLFDIFERTTGYQRIFTDSSLF